MAITLLELRTQTRQRADQEKSRFVTDAELNSYINSSIAELKDLLLEAYGSEYGVIAPYSFSTVSGTSQYALPTGFYELKGIDVEIQTGQWHDIDKFNFNERNKFQNQGSWSDVATVRYRLIGDTIMFSPTPDSVVAVRVWYIPVATKLVADADSLDDLNAYSEYVITDAAIKCMQKEESDVTVLVMQKDALRKRIVDKAANRDANKPSSVTDVYSSDDWGY